MTDDEWLASLGQSIREARIDRLLDQVTLARLADIAPRSLGNLEAGRGSSLTTLIKTVRALDREDWLEALDEGVGEPGPMERLRIAQNRPPRPQRVPRSRKP
ncbi:helix-turn-helix transcriptional regulator [Rathayibacter sp. Leaf296]|uniref:helix-turn-helix transcriptional regulator n=1 Tax=Rathayibacter sp. Leaf296 TaxID=1736327 RepID=UPI0007032CD8|nr:helix-turn-helix domain-containing protein [Rathayibacter sp. Leaf296]KQQ09944.1 hypothetical protein ASF46_02205 [Rathayibacter sp. Leaf296]